MIPKLTVVLFADEDIIVTSGQPGDMSPDVGEEEGND